jgi:hypothetical protein
VDGKIRRKFSQDGYSGTASVLIEAKRYWVRHAILAEVLPASLTGIAMSCGESTIIEVAKGHFVPKGLVDTIVYKVEGQTSRLLHQRQQDWFYTINPKSGEAKKHLWHGSVSLGPEQLQAVVAILWKLGLASGDCLEFGVLDTGQLFVIDIQRARSAGHQLTPNGQVVSLGEAQGILCNLDSRSVAGTETHFFEFAESFRQSSSDSQPVVVAALRPDIELLRGFEQLAAAGKRVVAVVFETYSPLCHLSVLLREWGIPAVVVPRFRDSELSRSRVVRVTATPEQGTVTAVV